jgi:predicted dehydrogenase
VVKGDRRHVDEGRVKPEPLKIAIAGAGGIANAYLDVIASGSVEVDVVAIVDPVEAVARRAAQKVGAQIFPEVHALAERRSELGVDALLVCTPSISHVPVASTALDAGMHVLCEKPMALNRPGVNMMLNAAHGNQRLAMMAAKYRYVADVQRTKTFIDAGELGEIVLFRNTFTRSVDMSSRWNARADISGGGVVIDLGTHSVDIARYLLGPIRHVVATETRKVQNIPVEDTAQLMIRTDSGVTGTIDLSWSLGHGSPYYVTIDGTKGSIRLGWDGSEINRGYGWESFGTGYSRMEAFTRQLTDFSDAVRFGRAPLTTEDDVVASVAVIDAAYHSMRSGSWTRVVEERRSTPRVAGGAGAPGAAAAA